MEIVIPSHKIYSAPSVVQGLGVFAREKIFKDEIIEDCPLILIPEDELSDLTKTKLFEYYFAWGVGFKEAAICLGFGSLYNHSYKPNAKYIKDLEHTMIRFVALEDIEAEQEILVNYNGHPDDKTKLWFLVKQQK